MRSLVVYLISYTRYAHTHTHSRSKRQLQISPSVYEKPRETTHWKKVALHIQREKSVKSSCTVEKSKKKKTKLVSRSVRVVSFIFRKFFFRKHFLFIQRSCSSTSGRHQQNEVKILIYSIAKSVNWEKMAQNVSPDQSHSSNLTKQSDETSTAKDNHAVSKR